jgi:hypothetical protein
MDTRARGCGAVKRVADKWMSLVRHARADLVSTTRADEFNFEKCVRGRRMRRFHNAQHAPTTTPDGFGFAARMHRHLRAALVTTGKGKRERAGQNAIGEAALDKREICLANIPAAPTERFAQSHAGGLIARHKQTAARVEIKSMDEPSLFKRSEFWPRSAKPRFHTWRIASPLRHGVHARRLGNDEPRRFLAEHYDLGCGYLRFHRLSQTLPDMTLCLHLMVRLRLLALMAVVLLPASPLIAEVPDQPMWALRQAPFELEVTILSVEEKPGPGPQDTSVWHRVRIDHMVRGDGLTVGHETAVVSKVHDLAAGSAGSRGMRGPFRGLNGLPRVGDRARLFTGGSAKILQPAFPNGWQKPDHWVSFIAADDEYRSEISMPFVATLVETAGIARTTLHFAADPAEPAKRDIASKTAISDPDALGAGGEVLYMRFNQLRDGDRDALLAPIEHGMPLVAFRTSTHAFAYPEGHQNADLNNGFGEKFLGTPWRFHHGHSSKTRILPPSAEASKHPILQGVTIPAEGLVVPSWLYQVEPLPADCTVLLWGETIDSERVHTQQTNAPQKQPILWVRERPPVKFYSSSALPRLQRIAVTTLGHPGDFANAEVRLIAVQMVAWANERTHVLSDTDRATIRATAFDPPPTR